MTSPPRQAMTYAEMIEQINAVSHLPEHLRASAMTKTGKLMTMIAETIAPVIGDAIKQHTAPLLKRIAELEARPMPRWAGPFKEGTKYPAMSFTVHQGGLWISKCATAAKPGTDSTWQLCCKRGDHG